MCSWLTIEKMLCSTESTLPLYMLRIRLDLERQMLRVVTELNLIESQCAGVSPVTGTRSRRTVLDPIYESVIVGRRPVRGEITRVAA